ncbi:hypothetical protein HMI51_03600 [Corallococcus coralloides]|nr:hypothetical protein [Corallococcus coralloides]
MNVNEMEEQLRKNTERIEQSYSELEGHVPIITAAVTDEVIKWARAQARTTAEAYFTSNTASQSVLAPKLPALYQAIEAVIARLPELTARTLDELATWQHRPATAPRSASGSPITLPNGSPSLEWSNIIAILSTHISTPLVEHGFLDSHQATQQGWVQNPSRAYMFRPTIFGTGPGVTMPQTIQSVLKPYHAQITEIRRLNGENIKLKTDIAKAAFASGWRDPT